MRAANCVNNLIGTDRDEAVKRRLAEDAAKGLPSSEDLDRIAEELSLQQSSHIQLDK